MFAISGAPYIVISRFIFIIATIFRLSCLYNSWLLNKITCHLKRHNVILFVACIPLEFREKLQVHTAFDAIQRASVVNFKTDEQQQDITHASNNSRAIELDVLCAGG